MYYVYSYLREDNSPYYIGKGTKGRAYASANHRIKAPKNKERIYIIKDNLTEEEAYDLEKLYILIFGRVDLETGILRNLSDGGEGPTGYKTTPEQRRKIALSRMGEKHPLYGVSPSEETREKQRQSLKGKYVGEKNPMYNQTHTEENRKKISDRHKGVPKTEEHKRKISEANKGKIHSEETIRKISEANKGKKIWLGKTHTEETKKKISESKMGNTYFLGKHHSEETKRKMSIAAKNRKTPSGSKAKLHRFTHTDGRITISTIPEMYRLFGYQPTALHELKTNKRNHHKDIIKVEHL
jgi:NUMOD3 motif